MAALNYAHAYQQALEQAWPYALYFGDLFNTPNNQRFRWVNARTIEIPTLETTGRVDSTRDTIANATRNYNNAWTPLTLTNERKWSTLVHPKDIDQTNMVASIGNITEVFNQEQKFPEMDVYCVSKIYAEYQELGQTPITDEITAANILEYFDKMMIAMAEARVPSTGRILYITPVYNAMLKQAEKLARTVIIGDAENKLNRTIANLDLVKIVEVPSELMKTVYDFTQGYKAAGSAKQIKMFMVHPLAVITPINYEFAKLDEPSAMSEGKWVYYEESHEDVFVLKKKVNAIQFAVEK